MSNAIFGQGEYWGYLGRHHSTHGNEYHYMNITDSCGNSLCGRGTPGTAPAASLETGGSDESATLLENYSGCCSANMAVCYTPCAFKIEHGPSPYNRTSEGGYARYYHTDPNTPYNSYDVKNGWGPALINSTIYTSCRTGCGNNFCDSYLKGTFLVQLAQVTRAFQYSALLDGQGYCLEVNGIKGRRLYLQRGIRYYFTFQIPTAVSDCTCATTGYVPPEDPNNYRFEFSTSPQAGDDISALAPSGLAFQLQAGDTLWCSLPRCTSEIIYYGLANRNWAGGAIQVYGGEGYNYH